jgi:hypothetical protein
MEKRGRRRKQLAFSAELALKKDRSLSQRDYGMKK